MNNVPEHILLAAKDLCEYCAPNVLALMVDEWTHETNTLELAQIALDAGIANCGSTALAEHFTPHTHGIVRRWKLAGLIIHDNPDA